MNNLIVFGKSERMIISSDSDLFKNNAKVTLIVDGDFDSLRGFRYSIIEFVGEFDDKERYQTYLEPYSDG